MIRFKIKSLDINIFIFLVILGNSYGMNAQTDPYFSITLSPDTISFHADSSPGVFESQPVDVTVRSDYKDWSIHCELITPIMHTDKKYTIPSKRLFIHTPYTNTHIDSRIGPGFETIDKPTLIAKGTFTGPMAIKASNLRFRLLTLWEDKPGTYHCQIRFTYLTTP